jgi:hypothetical protein
MEGCKRKSITYKNKPIKITGDFSTETLKARRDGVMYFTH